MNNSCVIKSSKTGLVVILDRELPFQDLIQVVASKFSENRSFFGDGIMTLGIDGRELTSEETVVLLETIEENSDLKIRFIEDHNEIRDIRMHHKIDRFFADHILESAKIHIGSVNKEDVILSDSSLIILGDVKSKATVRARGNIIILGSLEGRAEAGFESEEDHFYIVTNHLNSTNVKIGSKEGSIHTNDSFFNRFKKDKDDAVVLAVFDHHIVSEPLRSGYLNQIKEKIEEAEE